MTRIEKARKIMDDNGFFSKIGYVMKVLESNRKAKAVRCETRD